MAKHNAGVPGFVAKPGGGGRPVPARHVASVSEAIKGQRSLLWAPAAFLSTVIEAFRKVLFFEKKSTLGKMFLKCPRDVVIQETFPYYSYDFTSQNKFSLINYFKFSKTIVFLEIRPTFIK